MYVQVLGQAVLHALLSPILLVWSLLFCLASLVTKGNGVAKPRVIVITGASSGLGYDLAVKYAAKGLTLGLSGRSKERLEGVKSQCEKKGAKVELIIMDVNDRKAVNDSLLKFDERFPIDILIANAGVSASTCNSTGDEEKAFFEVFETNSVCSFIFSDTKLGVANCIVPLIPRMKQRKKGQLVIMGSLASDIGPVGGNANPYCASKAAIASMSASWRTQLKAFGIGVTLIRPGFVKTPLTDKNDFYMPMMISADKAAQIMVDGIAKDYAVVAYPSLMFWGVWALRLIPQNLISMVLRK